MIKKRNWVVLKIMNFPHNEQCYTSWDIYQVTGTGRILVAEFEREKDARFVAKLVRESTREKGKYQKIITFKYQTAAEAFTMDIDMARSPCDDYTRKGKIVTLTGKKRYIDGWVKMAKDEYKVIKVE